MLRGFFAYTLPTHSLILSTHSLRSFSPLTLFAHSLHSFSSRTLFTYSPCTLSTQTAFRWTSWKPCRFVHPNRISVDELETLPCCPPRPLFGGQVGNPAVLSTQTAFRWTSWKPCRFVHPNRFSVDKLNTALNHPIKEYAELLSFFPSTFSTYSCFLCLWVSFMLDVFRK